MPDYKVTVEKAAKVRGPAPRLRTIFFDPNLPARGLSAPAWHWRTCDCGCTSAGSLLNSLQP